ncbi:hypothetical protein K466DRAFT_551902 [Polyporus arcularius HHB13444]|uniref:SEC7 domain-containing protein n=1 Tax=Polyporus arcularius HHB13444 TaxID=1314778 RepID=A0A5C3PI05_9APHY|nr:hypothetical protein K466DRAFT_551902 [Polyporus arcularius HHB13444]
MDQSSAAEQRATAVAKLKRAASLPRMKDGRRPPMHVEAVSEGERSQGEERIEDEERSGRSLSREGSSGRELAEEATTSETLNGAHVNSVPISETDVASEAVEPEQLPNGDAEGDEGDGAIGGAANPEETVKAPKKRRSRSRTRSRGSKDMKGKAKQSAQSSTSHTNESSADEYCPSGPGEDAPPSPPLISPIPSHLAGFPASHFLRSPIAPVGPLFYPGTTPSTPLPSLDEIQKGVGAGLFRSNSAGAARAMAMSKLTGGTEPIDLTFISSQSPTPSRLQRNNTVAGGERMAARRVLLHRLGNRLNNQTDGEQTSGGEEAPPPPLTAAKKRRRRSHRRSSSRASTVVDDRDDREPSSTTPNTPLVPPSPLPPFLRATPEPPRPPSSASRAPNGDVGLNSPRMPPSGVAPYNYETPLGHRGVVIEDEDDVPDRATPPHLPTTPARNHRMLAGSRFPHSSDAPSTVSTDSAGAVAVPMFMSSNSSFRQDLFPASPFQTPLKEPVFSDEEEVPFQDQRSRSRLAGPTSTFERDSEISWVAELVTERPPVVDDDDEEEDEDEEPLEQGREEEAEEFSYPDVAGQRSSAEFSPDAERPSAPNPLIVDVETSPETIPAHIPPSPSSINALSTVAEQPQKEPPPSPPTYPMRLSVARSPSAAADYIDWDDARAESTPKRQGDGPSTWEKMKGAFSRSGSTTGRRSRTNSLSARERRYNTDSSVSRESGASLKLEKADSAGAGVFAIQQAQSPLMQSQSASASILSLAPLSAPPGPMSPVPPASSADLLKYADSKLFPFPALKQLEEQRRARGMTPSSSSPDVASPTSGFPMPLEQVPSTSSSSGATTRVADGGRDRKLSHQASDSRLWSKFSQPLQSAPSTSSSHRDYFNTPAPPMISPTVSTSGSLGKLPTNRDGVRKWLSLFKSQPSTPTGSNGPLPSPRPLIGKKPSLTDLLMQRKDSELTAQSWEESDKSRTPTNVTSAQRLGTPKDLQQPAFDTLSDSQAHGDADMNVLASGAASPAYVLSDYSSPGFPSTPDPPSSTTPDPQSSLDDFPTRSTSESFSSTMSSSHHSPDPAPNELSAGAIIMERLDEVLGRGSKSSLWPSAIDDPPRKLILSSPVLQVANANTVKDRFLFLFNDILIIAKPILQDMDALLDATKPSPLDRKFIVKSVVQLRELRFSGDRDDTRTKTSATSNPMRHPLIRNFVNQFAKDPDHAVLTLLGKTGARDDVALGQLLFRTTDLDRARLGDYLARRSSKVALKSFVDSFGLAGLRIDKALRVFLQAIHIPSRPTAGHSSALEYLLDSFASRWYDANATMVGYDKDVAIKLTRAIIQLNEVMHGGIAQEPGITGYPKRNVIARDFVEAFRRSDPRGLVSEELLDKIYASVRREKLFQARGSSSVATQPDIVINIKRPLPPRLTYRVQSEPVILRIPQPDPQLTIQLFGQDLVFDPPVLNFAKSSEVSFRVTGTALGNKTIIMWRSGANALAYSGLPLSSTVIVERSFMRNTFQVAFLNHTGLKRRYMFSVDDPLIRHQWTVSLKRQLDIASSTPVAGPSTSRAAEALAFKVLQDTLINSEENSASFSGPYLSPVDQAYARLNGGNRSRSDSVNSALGRMGTRRLNVPPSHTRSKSRSQLYRENGAGKYESELDEDHDRGMDSSPSQRLDGRLWSGHELEVYCRQNSSIPAVLAYLQVGLVGDGHANGNGTAS